MEKFKVTISEDGRVVSDGTHEGDKLTIEIIDEDDLRRSVITLSLGVVHQKS